MKVCGWFVAVRRAAKALRATMLWAGPGRGCVWSLCAALFTWFLIRSCDALQSFGTTEPEMGQERELKLEPLAAVWTRMVGRTFKKSKTEISYLKKRLSLKLSCLNGVSSHA